MYSFLRVSLYVTPGTPKDFLQKCQPNWSSLPGIANITNTLFVFNLPDREQSQELTRVNPDRNISSINVELTSTCFLLTDVWSITITEFYLYYI